jgi:hypothetical protein
MWRHSRRGTFGAVNSSPFPTRPFRFGVQLSAPTDGARWAETARRIESHGYAVATMPDHFTEQFAPVPALQAILDSTTTLRASALVFDNDGSPGGLPQKCFSPPQPRRNFFGMTCSNSLKSGASFRLSEASC